MKKILVLSLLLGLFSLGFAQKTKLNVNFKFLNIVEGYDHNTKCEVWIDDDLVGTSKVSKESELNSFSVEFPSGEHTIRVVNYAEYEGNWEAHTVENEYSIDCYFEETHNFKKKGKLFLLFDIDNGTKASWKKMPSSPKAK